MAASVGRLPHPREHPGELPHARLDVTEAFLETRVGSAHARLRVEIEVPAEIRNREKQIADFGRDRAVPRSRAVGCDCAVPRSRKASCRDTTST